MVMVRVAPVPAGVKVTFVPASRAASVCARLLALKSEIVLAICVPVCVVLSLSCASVALAVAPVATPASLVKSVRLIEPAAEPDAGVIEIAGAVPPDETIGAVPVTDKTLPPPPDALIV
jgi:hypothetical protein